MAERDENQSRDEQSSRGFDAMDNQQQQEISRMGGESSGDGRSEAGSERSGRSSNRGFAAMDPGKQKEIASEGGRAAHKQGVAHEWSSDEAREAGRKGGQIVSRNREHMSEIGRRGGQSSGSRRSQKNDNREE
ncbi:MAG: KGG domain-containing protein [Flavisolibacter sp.]|jgi:general stress protein YciG